MFSRRQVLGIGLAMSAAAATVGAREVREFARRVESVPALGDEPAGALRPRTAATLVAAAEVVTGYPIERGHYEEYYRWRSLHVRGYRALYERFARAADRDARSQTGRPFAQCPVAVRARILARATRARHPETFWEQARVALFDGGWPAFDRFVLGETLALFARTDAWVALGYDGWPGIPRGLERYRRAPG